jgi:multidrug transporter EmrE-like cation transporter
MKQSTVVGVWASLVATSVVEVGLFELAKGNLYVDIAIALIAAINATVTAMFSMDLRDESTAVKYLFLIPVLLVGVLMITLLLAFPVIS